MDRWLGLGVFTVALLVAQLPAAAQDASTRVVGPVRTWSVTDGDHIDPAWLHMKFVEGSGVSLAGDRFVDDTAGDLSGVNRALTDAGALEIRPTFPHPRSLTRSWKLVGERRSGTVGPDLSLWYDVRVDGGPAVVVELANALNASPAVEIAHPSPVVRPARDIVRIGSPDEAAHSPDRSTPRAAQVTPDFSGLQGYLYDTPFGLDAPAAWAISGGQGAGLKFIDVELSWTENHEDLDVARRFYFGGAPEAPDPGYEFHGTAVLGEVVGQHNGFGVDGFAPDALYGMVAVSVSEWPLVAQYFQETIDQLDAGDVWLIELQTHNLLPMEYFQVNYDVIWTGVWSRGVVCVEAAGNGGHDLDDPAWGGVFDRDLRDSGAIMAAAGLPGLLVAEDFSNYGSRLDAHAWGSAITTTGYGDLHNGGTMETRYTQSFGGTSGASPMLVGSALCLQGIALANLGHILDPITLRDIIVDTGTPQAGTRLIGPRPDLAAAAAAVLDVVSTPEITTARSPMPVVWPNPSRARTEIRFVLPRPTDVTLSIYDISGRLVRRLTPGLMGTGERQITWDGTDGAGRRLGSGIYLGRLGAGAASGTIRLDRVW